jgi:hypothetical protein
MYWDTWLGLAEYLDQYSHSVLETHSITPVWADKARPTCPHLMQQSAGNHKGLVKPPQTQ